tara:strand:+ start:154 stop:303 length:150 start_codon:yes stop_codon:yes gene_type:complete
MKVEIGNIVKVTSYEKTFDGVVKEIKWDFDQWIYLINGEWFCQSEVEKY